MFVAMLAIPFQSHRASSVCYPLKLNGPDYRCPLFVLVSNIVDQDLMLKNEIEKKTNRLRSVVIKFHVMISAQHIYMSLTFTG